MIGRNKAVDIRDACLDEIFSLALKDKNIIFLTDDMDAFSLKKFKKNIPNQFINIGVAEQNIVNVAGGLAISGKKVFAYGISSFITMRCFEQIKVNLCSMNLPVTLIGVGAGFSFGFDGHTHHGTQDIAVMRTLPEITIYNPSDGALAKICAQLAYTNKSPVYIRLDKGKYHVSDFGSSNVDDGFQIIRPLQNINIVSTGYMTVHAVEIADELEKKSLNVGVVDLFRIKPIHNVFIEKVIEHSKEIVVMEENSLVGGVGTIVSELLANSRKNIPLQHFAIQDKQFICYGDRKWLHSINGLSKDHILHYFLSKKEEKSVV